MKSVALSAVGLLVTLVLSGVAWSQEGAPFAGDPRLSKALQDLRNRDPETHRNLLEMHGKRPEQVRRVLERHADYLEELDRARTESSGRHRIMLEHEKMERTAKELVMRLRTSPDGAIDEAARTELRSHLEKWFLVRQQLRAFQIEELSREFQARVTEVDRAAGNAAALRERWRIRLLSGEFDGIEHTNDDPIREDFEAMAPAVLQSIMRRDPEAGEELARMADKNPMQFRQMIQKIVSTSPDLVREARASLGKEGDLRSDLHRAIRGARRMLENSAGRDVPTNGVDTALDRIVAAELAITRYQLSRVAEQIARGRRTLEFREQNQRLIVDIQLAELTGEIDRYEW